MNRGDLEPGVIRFILCSLHAHMLITHCLISLRVHTMGIIMTFMGDLNP